MKILGTRYEENVKDQKKKGKETEKGKKTNNFFYSI